jgi:hypothetical protein
MSLESEGANLEEKEKNPQIQWEDLVEINTPDGPLKPTEVLATANIARSMLVIAQVVTQNPKDPTLQLLLGYRSLLLDRLHQPKLVSAVDHLVKKEIKERFSPPPGNPNA